MSAVTNLIPKIEGFQPIPNAVMIPFMEAQSAALAYGFGLNYEFGKRKIRSMSNLEFNSLTSEQIAEISAQHSHVILQRFQKAVPTVMPMQIEIFKQYVEIEKAKVVQNVNLAKWVATNFPSILIEGKANDDPTNIRDTTKTGDRLAIGTQVGDQIIVGYIDGVPQYSPIPTPKRTDRAGSTTPPGPKVPAPPKIPIKQQNILVKITDRGNTLNYDGTYSTHVLRLNNLWKKQNSFKDSSLRNIYSNIILQYQRFFKSTYGAYQSLT